MLPCKHWPVLSHDCCCDPCRAQRAESAGSGATPLRLVLMSATADAELFASYMQRVAGTPKQVQAQEKGSGQQLTVGMLTIPGFTYPVREFYLEDILERTGHSIGKGSRYGGSPVPDTQLSLARSTC